MEGFGIDFDRRVDFDTIALDMIDANPSEDPLLLLLSRRVTSLHTRGEAETLRTTFKSSRERRTAPTNSVHEST